jgi:pyruvate formate lyase activating enzyme
LNLQLDTDGRNASVLEKLLEHKLGDRVVMEVKGPLSLYACMLKKEIDPEEIKSTIRIVAKFPEYRFQTTVAPVVRQEEGTQAIRYLTPEEIAETAKLIQEVTGSNKQPYLLRLFDPGQCSDDRLKVVEKMPSNALFPYRSAARKYQVSTGLEKS